MLPFIVVVLAILAVSLAIAAVFFRRGKTWTGLLVGVIPIAVMEISLQWYEQAQIRACLERACASAGLPPGCTIAEFGCSEWSGLSIAIFWIAGLFDVALYLVGAAILAAIYVLRRKREAAGIASLRSQ